MCFTHVNNTHESSKPDRHQTSTVDHSLAVVAWDNVGSPLVCTVINHLREGREVEGDRM